MLSHIHQRNVFSVGSLLKGLFQKQSRSPRPVGISPAGAPSGPPEVPEAASGPSASASPASAEPGVPLLPTQAASVCGAEHPPAPPTLPGEGVEEGPKAAGEIARTEKKSLLRRAWTKPAVPLDKKKLRKAIGQEFAGRVFRSYLKFQALLRNGIRPKNYHMARHPLFDAKRQYLCRSLESISEFKKIMFPRFHDPSKRKKARAALEQKDEWWKSQIQEPRRDTPRLPHPKNRQAGETKEVAIMGLLGLRDGQLAARCLSRPTLLEHELKKRKAVEMLSLLSTTFVTRENLDEKIAHAIENPTSYSQSPEEMLREAHELRQIWNHIDARVNEQIGFSPEKLAQARELYAKKRTQDTLSSYYPRG